MKAMLSLLNTPMKVYRPAGQLIKFAITYILAGPEQRDEQTLELAHMIATGTGSVAFISGPTSVRRQVPVMNLKVAH